MEKQQKIVEMAKDICRYQPCCNDVCKPISACDALRYAERAVEAGYSKQSGWISVDERLPKKEGKYLICTINGYVTFGYFGDYGGGNLTFYRNNPRFDYRNVIYWMPLPEAPKGGDHK